MHRIYYLIGALWLRPPGLVLGVQEGLVARAIQKAEKHKMQGDDAHPLGVQTSRLFLFFYFFSARWDTQHGGSVSYCTVKSLVQFCLSTQNKISSFPKTGVLPPPLTTLLRFRCLNARWRE